MLRTIPSQGCQLSLLQTFWYQNELPKTVGSRDKILPKYGHGRAWPFLDISPIFEIKYARQISLL